MSAMPGAKFEPKSSTVSSGSEMLGPTIVPVPLTAQEEGRTQEEGPTQEEGRAQEEGRTQEGPPLELVVGTGPSALEGRRTPAGAFVGRGFARPEVVLRSGPLASPPGLPTARDTRGGDPMARITIEDCTEKVPNRFHLVKMASIRTKQLKKGAQSLVGGERTRKWSSPCARSHRDS